MDRNLIFCFSGTGNSLKAAKDIAEHLGDTEIVLMKGGHKISGAYNRIGFVFPCYAGGVPKAVIEYISQLEITADSADWFFSVVTCGGSERDSLPMLRDALLRKGISLDYGRALHTVGNYIAMYPLKPGVSETLNAAESEMAAYVGEIKEKLKTSIGKVSLGVALFYKGGNFYFKTRAKKLAASDACTACGMCEKLCPTGSIKVTDDKPAFRRQTCAQCMACLQWCPAEAINCGSETIGRTRYHHPDVQAEELL